MTVLLILGVVLALAVAAAVLALTWWLPWRLLQRRRVMVNLRGGGAVAGVLWARRGRYLVLRSATLHEQGQQYSVDGEAIVERAQVAWIQLLPVAEPGER